MVRESIVQPEPQDEPEQEVVLRPKRIAEMVGQREVVEVLHIAIDAARKRGDPLGHILFDGPPGLGKTTFATCIPREMGVSVQMASGPGLKAPKDIVPYLTNLENGSVLFIDEIHRMPKAVEEYLYTAMEDFRIDIVLGEGVNARTLNLQLRPFTLIGATTRAGMLSGPLRDRFQIREHLGFYSVAELTEILNRNANKLNVQLDANAALEISKRSRGTPRVANNRLLWVRDYALSKSDGQVTLETAQAALKMTGIDVLGLDRQDRRYIETLIRVFSGGPAGIEAIAHTMNVSSDTLVDEVEPYLLRSELIIRTSRGRCATPKGFEHVNLKPPKDRGQDIPLFPTE
ncbi:MAG: Holliday junction branch migration DNA helicase RuvB [Pirellulaceae bacterium]|nr:Holliday junction branch migration DNA helicase RuvB [Pirellulaceae bacterium]